MVESGLKVATKKMTNLNQEQKIMVGTSPDDLITVEQTFNNGEKSISWVSELDYERTVVGKEISGSYWQHRVNLYNEDGTHSHVAHISTLTIIPPDEPSYDYYLQQYE